MAAKFPAAVTVALLGLSLSAHAALVGRDFDGNLTTAEAYYDTVLGITWLADANAIQTMGVDADGLASLPNLQTWVNGLVAGGAVNWRLPRTAPLGSSFNVSAFSFDGVSTDVGYNIAHPGSELGYMFYVNLGNPGAFDTAGVTTGCFESGVSDCLDNVGPFINLLPDNYWTEAPGFFGVIFFDMRRGFQPSTNNTSIAGRAWAVHDGDIGAATIAPVPVPGAALLFGSALAGLAGLTSRRRRAAES